MKKLLGLLATLGIISSTSITVIACGDPKTSNNGGNNTDDGEENGGEEGQGVNSPKNLLISLQKKVNEIIRAHLFSHSSIFEYENSETMQNYSFFNKTTFESFFNESEENVSTEWKSVEITDNDQKNALQTDLEKLIEKGQLESDLNELKNDQYYGYSYYLSGVDSVLKSITLNKESDNFQIKRISTTDSEGSPNFTYQVKVKFDVNWEYKDKGNVSEESALNNEYMFTLTNDETLSANMQKFLSSYKREILKLEDSFSLYDNKILNLDSDGTDDSNKYSAFSSVSDKIANDINSNNDRVLNQLNKILEIILENNEAGKYEIKGVNDEGTKLENLTRDSLSVSFDFFNNQTSPLTNIRPAADNQYLYHYLQTKVLGASDSMPGWASTLSPDKLSKIAVGQFLYDDVQVDNVHYKGLKYINMNDEKLKAMLVESSIMNDDSELSKDSIATADNAWSFGYINLANLKFNFDDTELSLPVLNIPYTYSIKVGDEELISKSISRLNADADKEAIKTNVIDSLSVVINEWSKNLHSTYSIKDTSKLNSIIAFDENSAFSQALNSYRVENKTFTTQQFTEALTTGNNNSFTNIYNVPFEFFIDLGKGFIYDSANSGFKIGTVGNSTVSHIQIKFGFFNFYLFAGSGTTIENVYNSKAWAVKFV